MTLYIGEIVMIKMYGLIMDVMSAGVCAVACMFAILDHNTQQALIAGIAVVAQVRLAVSNYPRG